MSQLKNLSGRALTPAQVGMLNTVKVIFWDFDGIIAGPAQVGAAYKQSKTQQLGARHALELLDLAGYTQICITGDSSDRGQEITANMLPKFVKHAIVSNENKLSYIREYCKANDIDYNTVVFIGDDVYDDAIAQNFRFITAGNAYEELSHRADYVSPYAVHNYLCIDIATILLLAKGTCIETMKRKVLHINEEPTLITDSVQDFKNTLQYQSCKLFLTDDSVSALLHDETLRDALMHMLRMFYSRAHVDISCTTIDSLQIVDRALADMLAACAQ